MEDGDTYDRWMIFERVVGIRSTFVIAIGRRVEKRSLYVLNFSKVKRVQVFTRMVVSLLLLLDDDTVLGYLFEPIPRLLGF